MKMYQVDAFTKQLFKGNSAAVLLLDEWLNGQVMQNIAMENNVSETAYVKKIDIENYEIRWFSPEVEIDFCGHATLASAFILFNEFSSLENIIFHVKKLGKFFIRKEADGKIVMNFPIRRADKIEQYPDILHQIVDRKIVEVYRNEQAYILILPSQQDVIDAQVNLDKILTLANEFSRSTALSASDSLDVVISSQSATYDFVSRYFAPHKGMNEDPVTGSMHTGLAPLWAEKLNKTEMLAFQASKRGGELYCKLLENDRIEIAGYAKLYMQAEIEV